MAWLATLRVHKVLGALLASIPALSLSCSDGSTSSSAKSARQAIYYGAPDTDRDAVMALVYAPNLQSVAGSCSGTSIFVDGGFGYLLTAAHCVGERDDNGDLLMPFAPIPPGDLLVIPGFDWATSTVAFGVQDYTVHPSYDGTAGGLHDLAVVRFYYGDSPTPATLPLLPASEDDLAVGDSFTLVGYGQTETDDLNTQRNQVQRDIAQLTTYSVLHSQDGGGTCSGDSGGPGLVVVGSEEKVAVVSSAIGSMNGANACETGEGLGVRVSAYESFIADYLAQAPADLDCDACLLQTENATCSSQAENCLTGTPCGDYLSCTELCQTASCTQDCATQYQQGFIDYLSLYLCGCGACETCGTTTICEQFDCGYSNADEWCGCVRDSCCTQAVDCTHDATCLACSTVAGFELGCDENEPFAAFGECIDGCSDACTSDPVDTGAGVDMVNWRDPGGTDQPALDAGTSVDAEPPDAGSDAEPTEPAEPAKPTAKQPRDGAGGEAGAGGSTDDEPAPPPKSKGGCGCRVGAPRAPAPVPWVFLGGLLLTCRVRRRRANAI